MKHLIIIALLAINTVTFCSCGQGSNTTQETKSTEVSIEVDKSGKEYTSEYICPMHCSGSGSEKAGKCSDCGMAYMLNKDISHEGHDHGHDHHGHDHDHNH